MGSGMVGHPQLEAYTPILVEIMWSPLKPVFLMIKYLFGMAKNHHLGRSSPLNNNINQLRTIVTPKKIPNSCKPRNMKYISSHIHILVLDFETN